MDKKKSTWEDVATLIPAGSVEVFYQAESPVGWTRKDHGDDSEGPILSAKR